MISLKTKFTCIVCGQEKFIDEFYLQKGAYLGVRKTCKLCCKKYQHGQYEINRERVKARRRLRYRIQVSNTYIEKPYPASVQQEIPTGKTDNTKALQ